MKKDITNRLEFIEKHETMPSLVIYPEGTATNGKQVLFFKKGPFKDFKPMKIIAV